MKAKKCEHQWETDGARHTCHRIGEHVTHECGWCHKRTDVDTKDAWEQLDDLKARYVRTWTPRPYLPITADAMERSVRIGEDEERHNVATVRLYAQALLEACAFVESSNPKWAGKK